MPHPILVSEPGGAVALLRPSPDGWARRELAADARWPAWRPGGDSVTFSTVHGAGDDARSAIELVDLEGEAQRLLYESAAGAPAVIAPNVPHYALWAPTGERMAAVAQGRGGLTLFLSDAEGPITGDPLLSGAPIFEAWSPDGRRLAIHAGVNLSVLELAEARASRPVSADARGFRVPAFSDDGALLAFAEPEEPGVSVRVSAASGEAPRTLRTFTGGVAIAFRPGTQELAVAVTTRPDSGVFSELWLVDAAGASPAAKPVVRGLFTAFYWAPAGDRLALIVPSHTGDGRSSVHVRGADGARVAATEPFFASSEYQTHVAFFDQYALSHPLWAPDGSAFLVAGRVLSDGVAYPFVNAGRWQLFSWPATRGAALEPIGPGAIGFFPARRPG